MKAKVEKKSEDGGYSSSIGTNQEQKIEPQRNFTEELKPKEQIKPKEEVRPR